MRECERVRVERLPTHPPWIRPAPVDRIGDNRMAQMGEVDADLVRAARVEAYLEQCRVFKALGNAVVGDRAPAGGYHSHAGTVPGISTDGRVDHPRGPPKTPVDQSQILAASAPGLDLRLQSAPGHFSLGYNQESRGVFVQPVDDARTIRTADLRQIGAMREHGVYERARRPPGAGMDRHARRLVDDEQGVIFIDHRQRDRLGLERRDGRRQWWDLDIQVIAGTQSVGRPHARSAAASRRPYRASPEHHVAGRD